MIDTIVFESHIELDIDQLKSVGFQMVTTDFSNGNSKRRLFHCQILARRVFDDCKEAG